LKKFVVVIVTCATILIAFPKAVAMQKLTYSRAQSHIATEAITYDIPLQKEYQAYIYYMCKKYNVSFELALSVAHTESWFNLKKESNTGDVGLFQINKVTVEKISRGINRKIDPYNIWDNISGGVWYLSYLQNYWYNQGYRGDSLEQMTLISYNRGITGTYKYMSSQNIMNNNYIKEALQYKRSLQNMKQKYYTIDNYN